MPYNVTINGYEVSHRNGAELVASIAKNSGPQFLEVWADRDCETMCMLANGDRAWLMYFRDQDEEYFSTRNPKIPKDSKQIEFFLSNGQRDFYPYHWTVTRELATKGLAYFLDHGGRTTALAWKDDNAA